MPPASPASSGSGSGPGAEAWSAAGRGERARTGVVVVHGFTSSPWATRPLGEALHGAAFTVEVPRLPGHGTSVGDLARTRYTDWLRALARVAADLRRRTDRVILVGHSVGGTLCLDLATRRAVEGVVTINALVLDPHQPLAALAPVLQYLVPRVPRDLAGMPTDDIARPTAEERAYSWVPARTTRSMLRILPRLRRRLRELTAPLLVLYSPQDHTVAPASSRALPRLVGSEIVRLVPLERSYHVATLDWDAEIVERETVAFAARLTG